MNFPGAILHRLAEASSLIRRINYHRVARLAFDALTFTLAINGSLFTIILIGELAHHLDEATLQQHLDGLIGFTKIIWLLFFSFGLAFTAAPFLGAPQDPSEPHDKGIWSRARALANVMDPRATAVLYHCRGCRLHLVAPPESDVLSEHQRHQREECTGYTPELKTWKAITKIRVHRPEWITATDLRRRLGRDTF